MALPDQKEQARLLKQYPFINFDFSNPERHRAEYDGRSQSLCEDYHTRERELTEWHQVIATAARLRERYPDLWVSVSESAQGYFVYVWIKRTWDSGREGDAEAFRQPNTLYLDDPALHPTLIAYQEQAVLAKQNGWFFCTGHDRAEQEGEGFYGYFAGKFCKEYAEDHPEHRAAAAAERYN